MIFENSLKIEFEKLFLSFNGPPPHFWPTSRSRPMLHPALHLRLGPAQLARLACLSAAPRLFSRAAPDRVRTHSSRGRHAPATHAARQPRPASPSMRSPSSAAPAALPTSLSRAASLLRPHRALLSRRLRHRSPAGKICRRCSTTARNQAHIAPPRSPAPGARGCDTF